MLHEEITQDIIGASLVVLNTLKPGLDEKFYENALVLELQARGHAIFSYPRKFALSAVKVFVDCGEAALEHLW